jgi:hypothetical protein
LLRIALELLSAAPGAHTAQLNRVLREVALADNESWQLVTEAIQLHLKNGGVGKVASLFLLANWKKGTDKASVYGRSRLEAELRILDVESGGALLLYCEGRPEAANLGAWTNKTLTGAGLTDLSSVISPHLPNDRSVKAAEKRKLLALLKRIPVTEFSIGNAVIRSVSNSSEANALALVDYLMSVEAVRTLVASALQGLGPADANPSDFLRTQLLRSVDRALPEWSNAWLDPLSED